LVSEIEEEAAARRERTGVSFGVVPEPEAPLLK